MYYKATFTKSGYTETVCIATLDGFKSYSELCGGAALTVDFQARTIIVHER